MPDKAVVHETGRHYADGPIPEVEPDRLIGFGCFRVQSGRHG